MKKWIVLVVIIGLGFAGYHGWNTWQKTKLASAVPGRPTTAAAEMRDITFAVNAAGEIAPAEQVSVRPEINGLLQKLPVDIGDRVKKDDLLFKLDDSELQQQKASNLTDIEKCKLGVEKAELVAGQPVFRNRNSLMRSLDVLLNVLFSSMRREAERMGKM